MKSLTRFRGILDVFTQPPSPRCGMNHQEESEAIQSQLDYYKARATEHDQWWLRQRRYDRGAELNAL